ncbi:MAG: GNAT family N-acetyltransferase [Candidatus Nanopelagicales bacterium]
MQIRRATLADAAAVRDIIDEVYVRGGWADPDTSPEYVRSLLAAEDRIADTTVLLAMIDGRPVGTVTAAERSPFANIAVPGELEVRMLGVLPLARRQGVAHALMAACEDLARQRGRHHVVLSTEPEMTAARTLYERRGYVRTPERDWSINGFGLITYARGVMLP